MESMPNAKGVPKITRGKKSDLTVESLNQVVRVNMIGNRIH